MQPPEGRRGTGQSGVSLGTDVAVGVRDMVGMAVCDRQTPKAAGVLIGAADAASAASVVSAADRVDDGRRGKEKGNLRTSVAAVALLVEPADRHLGFVWSVLRLSQGDVAATIAGGC